MVIIMLMIILKIKLMMIMKIFLIWVMITVIIFDNGYKSDTCREQIIILIGVKIPQR